VWAREWDLKHAASVANRKTTVTSEVGALTRAVEVGASLGSAWYCCSNEVL
jgi:hypothetical protein